MFCWEMTDEQLQQLAVCVHLTTLKLEHCEEVTHMGLFAICQRSPACDLPRLCLAGCSSRGGVWAAFETSWLSCKIVTPLVPTNPVVIQQHILYVMTIVIGGLLFFRRSSWDGMGMVKKFGMIVYLLDWTAQPVTCTFLCVLAMGRPAG